VYDPRTLELIAGAPALTGLDLGELPQMLTRAYAELVSLRLRLVEGELTPQDLPSEISKVRRLANAYEVIAAMLTDSDERRAAAFVAATAHHLQHRANKLLPVTLARRHLQASEISSQVAAVLLYIAAGYQSDASELASDLDITGEESPAARSLVWKIGQLAKGELSALLRAEEGARSAADTAQDAATEALWLQLDRGVIQLARRLLVGQPDSPRASAIRLFERARALAVRPVTEIGGFLTGGNRTFTTYAGPHHLAQLLILAGDALGQSALIDVPPPSGVPAENWRDFLTRLALDRPLLWTNHREAIASGYLNVGHSAVISFPTGSGKSTLSELKIGATLLSGRKTIFLAPTRALVWQVARDLERTFQENVRQTLADDGAYDESVLLGGASIAVMTPERCLSLLSSSPDIFTDVRLLVFDECHLMHSADADRSRRSLDSMLGLLGILEIAPESDVLLLSAMLANGKDVAAWIQDLTGRPCSALAVTWKPTRQVRGCVVYPKGEMDALQQRISKARAAKKTKAASVALRRETKLTALGLFALTQQWHSTPTLESYALTALRTAPVTLGINKQWRLTANKNAVATTLAAELARAAIKTIVLLQDKDACSSVARAIGEELGSRPASKAVIPITDKERVFLEAAADDLGGEDLVLGPTTGAAIHHGLLLPTERRLNESAFGRSDGPPVIVATPTLAQGMNLPAEAVLIGGDMRFDASTDSRVGMAAHELLNAAGRAGRAGHYASGLVLVIPDTPIYASDTLGVSPAWHDLQKRVFSHRDQCLELYDPIERILDRIQMAGSSAVQDVQVRYFLTRMPVHEDDAAADDSAKRLLDRSLAAYFAKKKGAEAVFTAAVDAALTQRRSLLGHSARIQELDRIATTLGWPGRRVRQIDDRLRSLPITANATVLDVMVWVFRLIGSDEELLSELTDLRRVQTAFDAGDRVAMDERTPITKPMLRPAFRRLWLWMSGETLWDIEVDFTPDARRVDGCKQARMFVANALGDLAFIAGGVAQISRRHLEEGVDPLNHPLALATISGCIRDGVDSPEKLHLRSRLGALTSRREVHRVFAAIAPRLEPGTPSEGFGDCAFRVDTAYDAWKKDSK